MKKPEKNMYSNAAKTKKLLLDTCVFLHYLLGDELADKAEILVKLALQDKVTLTISSEAYRFKGVKTSTENTENYTTSTPSILQQPNTITYH